jgi:uncharacterized membrane protein
MHKLFLPHLRKYCLAGLLTVLPLLITLIVLRFLFQLIGGLFSPVLGELFPDTPIWLKYLIFISAVFLLLYFLGLLSSHFAGRWFWGQVESILLKIPLLRSVYRASREVVHVFSGPGKGTFQEVVIVEFPRPGMKAVGFLTGSIQDEFGKPYYKVFIPTTPNPTTGFLEIVEQSSVVRSSLTIEEGIGIIMSGGILGPERMRLHSGADLPELADSSAGSSAERGKSL